MRRYLVIRTDKRRQDFIRRELDGGRLRQGWGWKPEHDLRALRGKLASGAKLTDEERAVWRNRRLLDTEGDGLKPDDIVILPNIPQQGQWVLARVTGPYRFEAPAATEGVGTDFGHVVPVSAVRTPDGKLAVVEADNERVDARLRASMRNMSRMWSVDALGAKVDALVAAVERGEDTTRPQPEAERFAGLSTAVAGAAWEKIRERYKGAEFETLVLRVFRHIYAAGRVEHWGGAGEKGADLIVYASDPLGLEFRIAVQVKLHEGEDDDLHSLDQIKLARSAHKVDAGVVLTTATTLSERFSKHHAALEEELGIDIRVLMRDEFLRLLLAHLGAAGDGAGSS
jgi:hypothetical protein